MVSYLFGSVFLAVAGLAVVVTALAIALPRVRERRELARHRGEIRSQRELDDFIRAVDQATSDDDLNRLGDHTEGKENG